MTSHFTLGIEEEFQLVDRQTGQLANRIVPLMEKGAAVLGEQIKPEMLQPTVELISEVYPDIAMARAETARLRGLLARLAASEGLALVSAGTHPSAHWADQLVSPNPRYAELQEEYQDVGRSILIFGLHVHVGVQDRETSIVLMNQLRTWLPHLLALTSNSPFWLGRLTGLKCYRGIVWRRFPRSGTPDIFPSWRDFDHYVQSLVASGCIDNAKRIWWDIRPHPFFGTIEFRACDMPAMLDDVIGIAALCQSLVAKLCWLYQHNMSVPVLPRNFIEENKWLALRYGLDAEIVDFVQQRRLKMRAALHELLDFIDDVLDDLGTRRDIDYLRLLVDSPRGTGADRQIAAYRETGSIHEVMRLLMEQTIRGIPVEVA
jgi:carboxylate-amine ligase